MRKYSDLVGEMEEYDSKKEETAESLFYMTIERTKNFDKPTEKYIIEALMQYLEGYLKRFK